MHFMDPGSVAGIDIARGLVDTVEPRWIIPSKSLRKRLC
jgi:hypothetical protein